MWRVKFSLAKIRSAARELLTLEEKDSRRLFEGTEFVFGILYCEQYAKKYLQYVRSKNPLLNINETQTFHILIILVFGVILQIYVVCYHN